MSVNDNARRRNRPAQQLYVPPAQRKLVHSETEAPKCIEKTTDLENSFHQDTNSSKSHSSGDENTMPDENIVDMLKDLSTDSIDKNENQGNQEDNVSNINKKGKKATKNNLLKIESKPKLSNKSSKKCPVKLTQVVNWEDLFDEEETAHIFNSDEYVEKEEEDSDEKYNDDPKLQQLEHVIELYEFPASFKAQDIMQIYSCIDKDNMYIKWVDETHALLVLGSSMQARVALTIKNSLIKSRPMTMAGSLAMQVATKCDLRPAMKRPETSMQAARRMITTALGAKTNVSKEVQEREREALRKAKELKRTQRLNENAAWEGNPRPSTA